MLATPFLRYSHTGEYKYVRKLRNKWQARPWVGGQRVNLGLFDSEWLAAEAVRNFVYRNKRPSQQPQRYIWNVDRGFQVRICFSIPRVATLAVHASAAEAGKAVLRDRQARRKAPHHLVQPPVRKREDGSWESRTVRFTKRVVVSETVPTLDEAIALRWKMLVEHVGPEKAESMLESTP